MFNIILCFILCYYWHYILIGVILIMAIMNLLK